MNSLLSKFEEMLDNEAKRIVKVILKMYEDGIIVNKSYEALARSLVDKKLKYYSCDIQLRTYTFLPQNLEPDKNSVFPLVSRVEAAEKHLLRYIDWCKNDMQDKDHRQAASKMAIKLIEYGKRNKQTEKTLAELVAKYMPNFFPVHHDSVDSRAVVLLLQNEININGYVVSSVNPFRIVKL